MTWNLDIFRQNECREIKTGDVVTNGQIKKKISHIGNKKEFQTFQIKTKIEITPFLPRRLAVTTT